jgi:hypothetical protein
MSGCNGGFPGAGESRRAFLRKVALGTAGFAAAPAVAPQSLYGFSTTETGQVLHNGIRLPRVWPPREMDPASAAPQPVPYLSNRPDVVPVDVGRQLFVDDFLVERTDLERRFHKPSRHSSNPVLQPETRHEREAVGLEGDYRHVCYLGHGGVFHDPDEAVYKMFYTAGWRGGLALAASDDLVNWRRPDVKGRGDNLILPPGDEFAGGDNCLWLDPRPSDPSARYLLMTTRGREKPGGAFIHTLHTSSDGLNWGPGARTGPASDYCSFFHNPFRNVWVYSIKQNGPRGRCRFYAESPDFLAGADWSQSVYWVNADKRDLPDPRVGDPPQLYSLNAVAYESLHLGMFYIHRGPHNRVCEAGGFPKNTDLEIAFSRDGFHWDRPDRTPFLAGTRREGDWDRAYLHGTAGVCLVRGDHLYFPYTGYSGNAPDGGRGMYTGASIGMAVLRRDGFASFDAGRRGGQLLTRPLAFSGRHLFVNVDCPLGELRVEVLDQSGEVIAPWEASRCEPVSLNATRAQVRWDGAEDLAKLRGRTVRLRFSLTNGALYSFWVSPDASGASRGHLGAGCPRNPGRLDLAGHTPS